MTSDKSLPVAKCRRIQTPQATLDTTMLQLESQPSGVQDMDLVDIVAVAAANAAYQAALATIANIHHISLGDFLR
jgi:hypothetical protein